MKKEPLCPQFEVGRGFIYPDVRIPSITIFGGCFEHIQYRFKIETNDQEVIENLTAAIHTNQSTRSYKEARSLRFSMSFRKALVKQIENGEESDAATFIRDKHNVSGRPASFNSIYDKFDWEEGKWISNEELLHCTLELGFNLELTEKDLRSDY